MRVSGPQMKRALERAEEIAAPGMGAVDVSGIPPRRLAELSRYGVDGKASLLRRHSDARRLATLLATTVYLTSRAVDDALDLLEVLIATKLPARAERESAKEKLKTLPRVERASAKLATAFQVVFDTTSEQVDTDTGEIAPPKVESLEGMWAAIEQVVPRHELAAAIAALFELTPPLDSDADEAWRAMLVNRFGTVRPFLKLLVTVVDFDATPEGEPVLGALLSLPELMGRKKVGPAEIDTTLLGGSWRRLVLSAPHLEPGAVDWKAYTFCVLEQLHRMLRSKQVFARNSSKWGDPRAKLLAGEAWQQARPTVLASLNLPGEAGAHLVARAALLDGTYREVAARVPDNAQIVFDDDGRLHFAALEPEPEPASLLDLRAAVNAMLPRVDLPEVLLEVMAWTGADQAFTSVTGGEARLKDLHVTIAALLVAHGCNVGYTPVMGAADPLKYGRLSHVDQTCLRLATYRAANAALIEHQASIPLVRAWGGGLVASVDGMRFVVPVPSVYARPNPKYFGRRGRRDVAQHDQRPGGGPGREGRGRHPARLPVRAGRPLRPRRRPPPGDDRHRHRELQRHRVRAADPGRVRVRAAAGGPAGPEDVADRPHRRLRRLPRRGPRPGRPRPHRTALGGHPADHRLHPHRSRPRLRRHPDALP